MAAENLNQQELNAYLADKSYIDGFTPSQADATIFHKLGAHFAGDRKALPHLTRWFRHIGSFSDAERTAWPGNKKVRREEKPAQSDAAVGEAGEHGASSSSSSGAAAAKKDEDDIDLFGEDEEVDEEAERAAEEAREKRAQEALAKKKASGKVLIAKSMVVMDVKPYDSETNLDDIEAQVREITIEGLEWKSSKRVEIAYGLKKLQISCVVEDEKVSIDDITEKIQENEEYVQSVDIVSFNKL